MEALAIPVGLFALFFVIDLFVKRKSMPHVPWWRAKGILFFVISVMVSGAAPLLWDETLGAHRVIDARGLGTWAGGLVAFIAAELGVYVWHRTVHTVPFLWRWTHQMHHSAERVDVA